jgi:hypothetical protein
MTKEFLKKMQKGIGKAGMETIAGIWKHMKFAERTDIQIICERKGVALSLTNIAETLSENDSLLEAVYNHAEEAEKRDLEILAS